MVLARFKDVLALDRRALSMFRLMLGAVMVSDWRGRLAAVTDLYTDSGMVPRDLAAGVGYTVSGWRIRGGCALTHFSGRRGCRSSRGLDTASSCGYF